MFIFTWPARRWHGPTPKKYFPNPSNLHPLAPRPWGMDGLYPHPPLSGRRAVDDATSQKPQPRTVGIKAFLSTWVRQHMFAGSHGALFPSSGQGPFRGQGGPLLETADGDVPGRAPRGHQRMQRGSVALPKSMCSIKLLTADRLGK